MNILISICARKGSKGLPGKNTRALLGTPLIAHTIQQAIDWNVEKYGSKKIVVSTDGEEIAKISRDFGADVPFLRPDNLATDAAGKIPVITHLLLQCERYFQQQYDLVLDLDPTSPIRSIHDIQNGIETFLKSQVDVCFSVTKARKNPYFNMVERKANHQMRPVMEIAGKKIQSRQLAPEVWDMNASIYVYSSKFLRNGPQSIWDGTTEMFEMSTESAFDIDTERDFHIVETLFREFQNRKKVP